MRIMSVISAIAVLAVLYFVVFERDQLFQFAQGAEAAEADIAADEAVAAETAETDAQEGAVGVVAIRSVAQTIDSAVILRGRTEAARQVTVASETSGLVTSEPLRKGAFVNAGDQLCQLDPGTRQASLAEARARLAEARGRVPEAQAAVAEASARVREAEINLNAASQLSQDGFASETRLVSAQAAMDAAKAGVQRANSGVASAEAGIESAQAAVASAEREIERLTITAPFSGLLETDTAELGALMQPGTPCATIIQLNPIKLVGFAPEADVSKITVGAIAGARLTNQAQVQGEVTFLSRSADETTRTFRVEVTVDNADLAISDGQTAEILVASEGRSAHLLAQSTLTLDDDGVLGVRAIDDNGVATFMPVTLLRDTAEGVWVTDLPEEVDIITVGQEFVVDGVRVTPTFQEAKG
ncbi:efflux RND transporter periplasmic adaptor subunit [Yoonia sp. SS1-5]|uniref:Efflux RND transporter periplasmic adaptor subunit n=1 Tax=Yoonia rhodophyticola TaxID=3137370 RepID=A0ABZ3JD36_9RHOB